MQLGSYAHRKLFCQRFLDQGPDPGLKQTDWPDLDTTERQRVQALPWLDLHRQKAQMAAIANTLFPTDPLIRSGLERLHTGLMQQHESLAQLLQAYDIPADVTSPPALPSDPEASLMALGFRQYLDAFGRGGFFAIARDQHYLPDVFLNWLDAFLTEDAQQTIWLANWTACHRQRPVGKRDRRRLRILVDFGLNYLQLLNRFGRSVDDATLPATASTLDRFVGQLNAEQFLTAAIAEHQQRLTPTDPDLVCPQLAIRLGTSLRGLTRAWPQRRSAASSTPL